VASIAHLDVVDQAIEEPEFTAEEVQKVHAALDCLIPEYREVLLLRYVENMSYEEIADVIQCPIGTVRSRIHNAKRALRRIFESGDER
jgi:RNA polymerase sigma-70 factor (ECF subfamily)